MPSYQNYPLKLFVLNSWLWVRWVVGPDAVKPHSVLQFSLSALCNLCNSNMDADSCCRLAFSLLSEHCCCVQLFKVQRSLKSTLVKTRKYFWMPTFNILFAQQSAVVWVSCHVERLQDNLFRIPRLNSVKNTNFFWDRKKKTKIQFFSASKIIFCCPI